MKSKRVLRYYCDHCPKSGCGSGAMRRHEEVCFANPARVCPLCREAKLQQRPIAALVAMLREGGIAGCEEYARTCPACVVAAIVQERKERGIVRVADLSEDEPYYEFDYRSKRTTFMNEVVYAGELP